MRLRCNAKTIIKNMFFLYDFRTRYVRPVSVKEESSVLSAAKAEESARMAGGFRGLFFGFRKMIAFRTVILYNFSAEKNPGGSGIRIAPDK